MKKLCLCLALLLLPTLHAQELVTLSSAETKPSNPSYRIERVHLEVDQGILSIYLVGTVSGEAVSCHYTPTTNPTGSFLIIALNKANLSSVYAANATTGSLKQRIFHRLIVMGESTAVCGKTLTGTLAGSVP